MGIVDKNRRYSLLWWIFVTGLFLLCGILGVLQYRWIGEVSVADRERLQQRLQADLNRLSREFNSELTSACRALFPADAGAGRTASAAALADAYAQWKKTTRDAELFQSIALAVPRNQQVELFQVDLSTGIPRQTPWPAEWRNLKESIESRLTPEGWRRDGGAGPRNAVDSHLFELPLFGALPEEGPGGPRGGPESGWLVLDLNLTYLRDVVLPELVRQYIGGSGGLDYQVSVVSKANPTAVIYQSEGGDRAALASADASVGLFDIQMDQLVPRPTPPGAREPFPGRAFNSPPDAGRWRMDVRNCAGSLEAVVASTRRRNLAVTGGLFLLLLASVAALLQLTRRAQRLAKLQLNFVAGVSHELRTPLTVIYGAAYNLRGSVAHNPSQVERYGLLLQQESGRLRDLVEQVLRFSSAEAGSVIREKEKVSIQGLIEQTMESSKSMMQSGQWVIEKRVEPGLPEVLGDPTALKHALQNLVGNAAKYGGNGDNWIGVFAAKVAGTKYDAIEIRVADHGPGIPEDEKDHIFDAFFRGRRAIQEQIHGTGLGLNLVKKIIEAHGGSIRVESEPMKRTDFIIRLPAMASEGSGE